MQKEKLDITKIFLDENHKRYEDVLFINQRPDNKKINDVRFSLNGLSILNSTFAKMGFRETGFAHLNLSYTVFIDCYFRNAKFENVDFTGCTFINCNFEGVTLISCNFMYAKFENCYIEFEKMKPNLPSHHNLRWKLCINLSIESLKSGQDEDYRKYFYAEKEASEQHNIHKLLYKSDKYYEKYSVIEGIIGFLKFIQSKANKYLWGYGERLDILIRNILGVILGFGILYYLSGPVFKENGFHIQKEIGFWDSLYVSACNFFTITSDYTTSRPGMRLLTAVEGFIGIILMGFFIAALFRYINRRG